MKQGERMYFRKALIASILVASLATLSSGAARSEESGPTKICQLMQMERGNAYQLDSLDELPSIEKVKTASGIPAGLDVTPIISWIDDKVPLKAVLVCVHGLGLHKENYEQLG